MVFVMALMQIKIVQEYVMDQLRLIIAEPVMTITQMTVYKIVQVHGVEV